MEEQLAASNVSQGYVPSLTSKVGLLVLSSSNRVLHLDEQASQFLGDLQRQEQRASANGLPPSVETFCSEIQDVLSDREEAADWRPFEVKRSVGQSPEALMLRAFVFPSRSSLAQTRILVTLQKA
ncbi:MAG: hypothetical protein NW703_16210 [Nitrospiraceae bacterium]